MPSFLMRKKEKVGVVPSGSGYRLPGGEISRGESELACLMRTVGADLEIAGFLCKAAQETGARSMDEGLFYLGKWGQPRKGSHNLEWLNLHEAAEKIAGAHHQWAVQEGISAVQASTWF
ncbi:hypothetical protein B4099_2553 [Heyndrickxia coagulans]|uniref:Uncharacterized protein n=2 Tax=Heyndrickxia coagulans TaxID=1398 RepID=A0A150JP03_HEYCO|nr:hypothetical protein B4099_2553 [Heyndrickxia coagulans]